jgi:hypothetical protein
MKIIKPSNSQRAILPDNSIISYSTIPMNDYSSLVLDNNPSAEFHAIRQFYAVDVSAASKSNTIKHAERSPEQFGPDRHSPDAEAMNGHRPKPRLRPVPSVRPKIFSDGGQELFERCFH